MWIHAFAENALIVLIPAALIGILWAIRRTGRGS